MLQKELDRHIRVYDPAIDWDLTPIEWSRTRDDRVRFKSGLKPTVFVCSRLTVRQEEWVCAVDGDARFVRAFASCLRRVEKPDGTVWVPSRGDSASPIGEDELALFSRADRVEIGSLIYEVSTLPFDCDYDFTLQPSSLRVLGAMESLSRRVELHRAEQAQIASEREGL